MSLINSKIIVQYIINII